MRRKMILHILSLILFSLVIMTSLVIIVANYEYLENTKQSLKINNQIIYSVIKNRDMSKAKMEFKESFKNELIRETLIDVSGKVIADSETDSETMDNHNAREELIQAREKGIGYSVRFSKTINKEMLYAATAYNDGYIIRSAVPMQTITGFELKYMKYYLAVTLMTFLITFLFSTKITSAIVEPIKELELTTAKIANGELERRVNIFSKDEIGQLANTFNNMADKLQMTLTDSYEKQNKLEAILKSMESGVVAVDNDYRIIIMNPYAKKIFGINKDIIGEKLLDHIRDFELEDILKQTDEGFKELTIYWPEQKELRVRTTSIINGVSEIGRVAVVQDVTKLKKLENMRSQFVANVSHELKTPLTSIKGFAETLKYIEDATNKEKFLSIINHEADRLTRLINDILTLSHIETTDQQKIVEFIDVNQTVNDVYYLMKNTAAEKKIKLYIVGEQVPNIWGDGDRFKQMLINLVDNAIKYSEKNDTVTIGTEKKGENCILWVKDTGVGIEKEHIDRLFERFYRVDKARSRNQGGTGLGLAIVKHIVINLNGNINIESEVGKGSKFIVTIPYVKEC